jgi:hypothetical protein
MMTMFAAAFAVAISRTGARTRTRSVSALTFLAAMTSGPGDPGYRRRSQRSGSHILAYTATGTRRFLAFFLVVMSE